MARSAYRLVRHALAGAILAAGLALAPSAGAQVPPTASEIAAYQGLHAAAARGDTTGLQRLLAGRPDVNARDAQGRTPLHVATFARQREAFGRAMTQVMRGLIERPYFLSLMLHEALGGWRNMPAVTVSEVPKALTTLFRRAQREGVFRSDVSFESIYLAALGAMTAGYLLSGRFEVMRDNEKRRDRLVADTLELVLRGAAP